MWRDVIVVCRDDDLMESYDFMVALLRTDWAEKMKNEIFAEIKRTKETGIR